MKGGAKGREKRPAFDRLHKAITWREFDIVAETITLLARMARFVIVDISDAKSILQELRATVPELPSVPVQPVIIASQDEPGMFNFYRHIPWFLPVHRYDTPAQLNDRVIEPSEAKVRELRAP
jgi:hypothetical protein